MFSSGRGCLSPRPRDGAFVVASDECSLTEPSRGGASGLRLGLGGWGVISACAAWGEHAARPGRHGGPHGDWLLRHWRWWQAGPHLEERWPSGF